MFLAKLANTGNPVFTLGDSQSLVGFGKIPLYANQQLQSDKAAEHFKSKAENANEYWKIAWFRSRHVHTHTSYQ
jgi:hypothetical protein